MDFFDFLNNSFLFFKFKSNLYFQFKRTHFLRQHYHFLPLNGAVHADIY